MTAEIILFSFWQFILLEINFTIRKDAHGHNHNPDLDALCLKTTWFAHPDIDILRALGKS